MIRTVTGDLAPADAGITLAHEHIISDLTFRWQPSDDPDLAGPVTVATLQWLRHDQWASRDNMALQDIAIATSEVAAFGGAGGGLLVELSNRSIGRDARALRLISKRSGVHIVAGTGYYVAGSMPMGMLERSVASVADEMVREIVNDIDGAGIRAGVIGEIGAGQAPIAATERLVLRAAALAQSRTGAGIVVHPAPGTESAFEVLDLLVESGADPGKVCVAHLDERFRGDMTLFEELGKRGSMLGFDTFGREGWYRPRNRQHPSVTDRIAALLAVLDAGYGERIVLAQDLCMRTDLGHFGGPGYAHVLRNIVPRLLALGVPDEDVRGLLVRNPARLLALPGDGEQVRGAEGSLRTGTEALAVVTRHVVDT